VQGGTTSLGRPATDPEPFAYRAAQYSAILPIGALLAMSIGARFTKDPVTAMAFLIFYGVLLLGSFVLGVVALCEIPRYGAKRILVRSLIGIGLSLGIVAWWVWVLIYLPKA
jgi:hypothetical protein